MTSRTKNEIEEVANQVLNKYQITEKPYSHIREICKAEGIKIRMADLSDSIDGVFSLIGEEKYIFINKNKPEHRQNFTKAHELGHYFLGHSLDGSRIVCNIDEHNEETRSKETEANYFASFFLMPERLVRRCFVELCNVYLRRQYWLPLYVDSQRHNKQDWNTTCSLFGLKLGVSKEALRYRLENLGLLKYNIK